MEREHVGSSGWYRRARTALTTGSRARWAVPAVAVVAVGAVAAGTAAAGAQAAPSLSPKTPAQLLAGLAHATGPGPMTATIQESASLGLPEMPGPMNDLSPYSLLSGTHTFQIWYGSPGQARIAEPVELGESDLRLNGRQAWLWNSKTQTATHLVLPARQRVTLPRKLVPRRIPRKARLDPRLPAGVAPTPLAAARHILAAIGPTTAVSVQPNVTVAGRAAYQLAIAPKSSGSLIGRITVAIDANGHFPLRLQVFARGASRPAFSLGYSSLAIGRPAASNFAFTPPPGAKVKTVKVPARMPFGLPGMFPLAGLGPFGGALFGGPSLPAAARMACLRADGPRPAILRHILAARGARQQARTPAEIKRVLRRGLPKGEIRALRSGKLGPLTCMVHAGGPAALPEKLSTRKAISKPGLVSRQGPRGSLYSIPSKNWVSYQPITGGDNPTPLTAIALPRPQVSVMGKGWLSVLVIKPAAGTAPGTPPMVSTRVGKSVAVKVNGHKVTVRDTGLGGQQVIVSPASGRQVQSGPLAGMPPYLGAILKGATPVHGAWGSGRLIRTALFSALITSKGTVLIGSVTQAVLYADASAVK